ncbi:hypothetical protein [Melissospora conviva]|uniref:hypothetical protein n=1 Tax=Melissospora conviva TaxID=3388432 RepID=UPI003C1F6414
MSDAAPDLLLNGAVSDPNRRAWAKQALAAALTAAAEDPESRRRRSREAAEAQFGRRAA